MTPFTRIHAAKIFTGTHWIEDHSISLHKELIHDVTNQSTSANNDDIRIDYSDKILVPGFLDTQVNGAAGVLFNDAPTLDTLETLALTHAQFGTSGLLPTLITDDWQVLEQACTAVEHAIERKIPGILGIHLEGPFLNPLKCGIHDSSKMRLLDATQLARLPAIRNGKMLITLAPELCDSSLIQTLTQKGILVAAGHSAANYAQTKLAIDAGVRSFTHLFNAMTPLNSREPGMVGAALEDTRAWCSLIVDGYHVHPATLKIACAAKPSEKLVLVTDAMPSVGSKRKNFTLNGEEIFWRDGKLTNAGGTLAGSDLSMIDAVKNSINLIGLPLEQALKMASRNPAAMLGLENSYGKIEKGFNASFVVLDADLNVFATWVDGNCIFTS